MTVTYSEPIARAWRRMTDLLLRPFDLGRWFALGWTAFLASFLDGGSGNWGGQLSDIIGDRSGDADAPGLFSLPSEPTLVDGIAPALLVTLGLFAVAFGLVLAWVGARGQFMLLDNIVHKRAAVAAPWREFRAEANSLFLWSLVFWLLVAMVILLAVFFVAGLTGGLGFGGAEISTGTKLAAFIVGGTLAFVVVVFLVYVDFFLLRLVVPIMHHRRCSCSEAWAVFGAAFKPRPWPFVLYGLLAFALSLAAFAVIIAAGLGTLCIGFLLLLIPYLGTVLTLPVPVLFRSLDLEWLSQFGPELYAFPAPAAAAPLGEVEGDGTVVGPEDPGQDAGPGEPRPEDA